jgi:hypothetical protein
MVIGAVFVALVILIGILLSISNPQDESASHRGGGWEVGDEVTFEAEVFGYPEVINYDGAEVEMIIVDYHSTHVAVLADIWSESGSFLTGVMPGSHIRVSGTYQGIVVISGGGSYDGVLADDVEFVGS